MPAMITDGTISCIAFRIVCPVVQTQGSALHGRDTGNDVSSEIALMDDGPTGGLSRTDPDPSDTNQRAVAADNDAVGQEHSDDEPVVTSAQTPPTIHTDS